MEKGQRVLCIGHWPAKKLWRGMVGEVMGTGAVTLIKWDRWSRDPVNIVGLPPALRAGRPLPKALHLEHLPHHEGTIYRALGPKEETDA